MKGDVKNTLLDIHKLKSPPAVIIKSIKRSRTRASYHVHYESLNARSNLDSSTQPKRREHTLLQSTIPSLLTHQQKIPRFLKRKFFCNHRQLNVSSISIKNTIGMMT